MIKTNKITHLLPVILHYKSEYCLMDIVMLFPQSFIRVWFFWESRLQHKCSWWLQVLWNFWTFEIFWNFWNFKILWIYTYRAVMWQNRIGDAMVSVNRGFGLRSCQLKDYKIGICCFSTKQATLRIKNKNRLARN
jgi:hypothetical protein